VTTRSHTIALLAAAALGVGACGSDEDDPGATNEPVATVPTTTATTAKPRATETETGTTATSPTGAAKLAISKDRTIKPAIPRPEGEPPAKLVIQNVVKGKGEAAKEGDTVLVQYVGVSYSTGEQFDASWDRNEPFDFQLGAGGVIAGWDQGVVGMKKGGRRTLIIPADLAYGAEGRPGIAPNETLVFVIDLLRITRG
jgi:peptidylprolyl isomerase